jgi:beta-lactam-binding protein with PASTA domain
VRDVSSADHSGSASVAWADERSASQVREYFNNEGFNRWNKIYSESDDVNVVQQQIRNGHQVTVDKVRPIVPARRPGVPQIRPAGAPAAPLTRGRGGTRVGAQVDR